MPEGRLPTKLKCILTPSCASPWCVWWSHYQRKHLDRDFQGLQPCHLGFKLPLPCFMNNFKQGAGWHRLDLRSWKLVSDVKRFSVLQNPRSRQEDTKPPAAGEVPWPSPRAQQAPKEMVLHNSRKCNRGTAEGSEAFRRKLFNISNTDKRTGICCHIYTSLSLQVLLKDFTPSNTGWTKDRHFKSKKRRLFSVKEPLAKIACQKGEGNN